MNTSNGSHGDYPNILLTTTTTTQPQIYNGPPDRFSGAAATYQFLPQDPGPVVDAVERARVRKAIENLEKEQARIKARQEAPPMHWWVPDKSGHICAVCDFDNIYRGAPLQHMPVIKEDPELEDWWRELGAA